MIVLKQKVAFYKYRAEVEEQRRMRLEQKAARAAVKLAKVTEELDRGPAEYDKVKKPKMKLGCVLYGAGVTTYHMVKGQIEAEARRKRRKRLQYSSDEDYSESDM